MSAKKPLAFLFVGVLLVGGWFIYKGTPLKEMVEKIPGVGSSTPRVTEDMFSDIADPLVRKNMVAMSNQSKFRMRSTFGMGKQVFISNTEMEMKGDSYSSKSSQEQNGKVSGETIMMGDTTYMKDYSDNKWWKETAKPDTTVPDATPEPSFTPEDFKEIFDKSATSTFTLLAEEACPAPNATLKYYKYEEAYSAGSKRTWWFDTKKFLTRRDEMGAELGNTVVDYSYEDISITAPSPIKEVPEGKSIYEVSSEQQYQEMVKNGSVPDYSQLMEQFGQPSEDQQTQYSPETQEEPAPDDGGGL